MPSITCEMCGDLRLDGVKEGQRFWKDTKKRTMWELRESIPYCNSGGCELILKAITSFCEQTSPDMGVDFVPGNSVIVKAGTRGVQLFVTKGHFHPLWSAVERIDIHQDLSSDESLAFLRQEMMDCVRYHPKCKISPEPQPYMPTRILDIGCVDDGSLETSARAPIKLVESIDVTSDRLYTCLSHRWEPKGQTLTTERATYKAHKDGIAFKDLDLAYQDTVHVMRRLSVRYVWIDSLCILQDDADDWRAESETMAKVYNNAHFTLARHGNSSTSIRYVKQEPHLVSDPSVSPPVFARIRLDHIWAAKDFFGHQAPFPLLKRGWIYQERLLSPRIVHFTAEEILWECYGVNKCQCDRKISRDLLDKVPKLRHARALGLIHRTTPPNPSAIRERWRNMVAEYTELELTKLSDRLPAIEGCAEQIKALLKDSYFFGLWERGTAEDLAWHTIGFKDRRSLELAHVPTWSWGSVAGKVRYERLTSLSAKVTLVHALHGSSRGQRSVHWIVTGESLSGRLKLAERSRSDHGSLSTWDFHVDIQVDQTHPGQGAKAVSLSYPFYVFHEDFDMRVTEWHTESCHDIEMLRLGATGPPSREVFLVLWRHGKSMPGSKHDRETIDGVPIYQRIGLLTMQIWRQFAAKLDWTKRNK